MPAKLQALKVHPMYVDEPGTIYNGMRPEETRQLAEAQLNDLIERLMHAPGGAPAKRSVLSQFRETLAQFPGYDAARPQGRNQHRHDLQWRRCAWSGRRSRQLFGKVWVRR
jgi:hypothetical protein